MNIPQSRCDDTQLIALINDRLGGEHLESMILHVEECDRCRMRMDDLTADSYHWQKTINALSDSQYTHSHHQSLVNQSAVTASQMDAAPASLLSPASTFKSHSSEMLVKQLLSPPSHPEMLGRLGRYEVERVIGSGGMGVVFKAFDTELNRPVAIKVLAPHLATCGSARQRFAREAKAAAAVVNEHVVPIHNVETEGETPFLVMKYINGESLQARLDREGSLEVDEILRIGMQTAAGLAAAHQQGLVHRDIKPGNILLEQGLERALITDFGLARAVDDASLTHSGFHVGTPQYMSPEQVTGQGVDCSSDLFSLGSVLYAMCTGRPPFRAENSFGVLKRIAEDSPRAMQEINPRIPLWLECIVNNLLIKSPKQRLHSATEASQLFSQCLKHMQNSSSSPLPQIVVTWMNEAANCRLQATDDNNVAKGFNFVLANRRWMSAAAIVIVAAGTLAMFMLNKSGVVSRVHQSAESSIVEPRSSSFDSGKELSTIDLEMNQTFDPELEWDTAIRATQSLQHEADQLEQRIMQQSVAR